MFQDKLHNKLKERIEKQSLRQLGSQTNAVDFSSNDYLGFANSKTLFEETHRFLVDGNYTQNGATGSRLLSGNHELYTIVEKQLNALHKSEALIYNSGYDANLGFFSAVPQRHDVVLYDEYAHASIRDGIRLSNAKAYGFKHNDLKDLQEKLQKYQQEDVVYVVTESVFSMDGDSPDLVKIQQLCAVNKTHLVVDEAHAIGVFGLGLVQQLGLEQKVFARIVTFGKALGCHGAAILGSAELKEYLINFSRSFIYTTGLSPHALASVRMSYRALFEIKVKQQLETNIQYFKNKYTVLQLDSLFINSNSAIQCCVIPRNSVVKKCAQLMQDNNFNVLPILSPTVPEGKERLRFCVHSYNTRQQIDEVLNLLSTFVSDNL